MSAHLRVRGNPGTASEHLDYLSELTRALACREAYGQIVLCENSCTRWCPCAACRAQWRFLRANLPRLQRGVR